MTELLRRWETLRTLLSPRPRASDVRRTTCVNPRLALTLRCERNFPFEFVDEFLDPYLSLWHARHNLHISDYDAALPQVGAHAADVTLFWLDWRQYAGNLDVDTAIQWLVQRLRAAGAGPRLVNTWPETGTWYSHLSARLHATLRAEPDVYLLDLQTILADLGADAFDARNDAVTHWPFSSAAAVLLARHLGTHVLPALCGTPMRGIVLDLDDTLYRGVLGEDGHAGVVLTPDHHALQTYLVQLQRAGMMLALVSRNELADVHELFTMRSDFPLRWEHFASTQVSWQPKRDGVVAVIEAFNIQPATVLMVDDNPAELLNVSALPDLHVLPADPDAAITLSCLRHYPGMARLRADSAASVRSADVRANQARERMRAENPDVYLARLGMVVTLHINTRAHNERLYDLSHKTNQFNLALARLPQHDVERAMATDWLTVTVGLRDRLADSGIIGAIVVQCTGSSAHVREVLFSCRALGRDVETVALLHVCRILRQRGVVTIAFAVAEGPRNHPARQWLRRFAPANASVPLLDVETRVAAAAAHHPAQIVEVSHE